MKTQLAFWLVGALLMVASTARAATLCSAPGAQPDGLDVADVTFNGKNANDCNGVFTGTVSAATIGFDGFTAVAVGATEGGNSVSGSFGGVTFALSALASPGDPTGTTGSWTLTWSGVTGPFTIDLVAVVESASGFASYFFDNLVFNAQPGSGGGTWVVMFPLAENGSPLGAFSLFAANFAGPSTPGTPAPPAGEVSEPATLALLAFAALGLGRLRRMRERRH